MYLSQKYGSLITKAELENLKNCSCMAYVCFSSSDKL